jgi:hypothetical protein
MPLHAAQLQLYNYRQTFMMLQLCIMKKTKDLRLPLPYDLRMPYDLRLPYDLLLHIASFMPKMTIQDYKALYLKYMEHGGYELSPMVMLHNVINNWRYVTVTDYDTGDVVGMAVHPLRTVVFQPSQDTPNIKPWQEGVEHDLERSTLVSAGVRAPYQMQRMQRGNLQKLKKFQKDLKYQEALWEVAVLHPKRKGNTYTAKMKKAQDKITVLQEILQTLEERQDNLCRGLRWGLRPPTPEG